MNIFDVLRILQVQAPAAPAPSAPVKPPRPAIITTIMNFLRERRRSKRQAAPSYYPPSGYGKKALEEELAKYEVQGRGFWAGLTYPFKKFIFNWKFIGFLILVFIIVLSIFLVVNPDLRQALKAQFGLVTETPLVQQASGKTLEITQWARGQILRYVFGIRDISNFETRPGQELAEEIKGIDIIQFVPTKLKIFEGEPFTFKADVSIDGLEQQDTEVAFGCLLYEDDKSEPVEGTLSISGYPSDITSLTIPRGQKKRVQIYCNFNPINEIYGQSSSGYKVHLAWAYKDFITKTQLRLYTQRESLKQSLISQGQDPIKNIRGGSYVDKDGYAKAQCVEGCGFVDLGMNVFSELPLSEIGEHHLSFRLQRVPTRNGNLLRLNSMTIQPSQQIEFENEECLVTNDNQLAEINLFLVKEIEEGKKPSDINERDCVFTLNQAGAREIPQALTLTGSASYFYGGAQSGTARIWKKEGPDTSEVPEA